MKLFYVIDSLAPGGAETSLAAMAPGLRDHGIDLTVATFWNRPGVADRLRDAGATLLDLSAPASRPQRAKAVRDAVRATTPDLVHTTLFESDVAGRLGARLAGVPVVTSLVNEQYGPTHRPPGRLGPAKKQLARALDASTAQLAVGFHANSASTAAVMGRRLGIPARKITVIHRGRDGNALGRRSAERRAAVRSALGLAEDRPVVLAVGRHEPQKAFEVVVRAAARLPDVVVLVAGREGNATSTLTSAIAATGVEDRVRLLGHRTDIADLMVAADVLAFPSRFEGLPGTCIEAMALELPVVASDIGPVREVVGDPPAARLVPVDDTTALADAIATTLDDRAHTREQTDRGRQRFEELFTIQQAVAGMVRWYRTFAGAPT